MTDIKEAREIELKSDWDLLSSPSRRIAAAQQAVIDQLRERIAELERKLIEFERFKLNNELLAAELAATKEHLHTVEPEFHSLQATRNMAEKTVETMIRRAESAEAELAAIKSAPVVMPDRRIQALAGVSLFDLGHAKGWNACLDKFESLNRIKTNE